MIDASRIGVGSVGALPKKYIYIRGVPFLLKGLLKIKPNLGLSTRTKQRIMFMEYH